MWKQDPSFCCIQWKIDITLERGWKKIFQTNAPKKQTGVAILISNTIDFHPKLIKIDWEEHFILFKRKLHQGGISLFSTYAPNARAPTFVKETLLKSKSHVEPHTLILEDFTNPLSWVDRWSKQKLNRKIIEQTDIMTQMDLIYLQKFLPKHKACTFFSVPHRIFSKIDHILKHILSLTDLGYKVLHTMLCVYASNDT